MKPKTTRQSARAEGTFIYEIIVSSSFSTSDTQPNTYKLIENEKRQNVLVCSHLKWDRAYFIGMH